MENHLEAHVDSEEADGVNGDLRKAETCIIVKGEGVSGNHEIEPIRANASKHFISCQIERK